METTTEQSKRTQMTEIDTTIPDLTKHLRTLLEFAERQDNQCLRMKGPWRLHPSTSAELTEYADESPPGGWDSFTGLVCGAEYLEADSNTFEPQAEPEVVAKLDDATLRRQLIEGFSRQLIPPSAAAGLFLLLDIHPVWGLRVARRVQREHRSLSTIEPAGLSEDKAEVLETVRSFIFDVIDGLFDILRRLEPDTSYCIEHIIDAIGEVVADNREAYQLNDIDTGDDISVRISGKDELNRLTDFLKEDLFDSVLVPAGVVYWLDRDENWFGVREDAFADVEID
jgi:hypothetical protein